MCIRDSHRAISQLVRVLSLDYKNEIIIFTHIGDHWMTESDPNGWETYSELPTQRFQHQYFDDTNLIKNMVFDLDAVSYTHLDVYKRQIRRGALNS